MCEASAVAPACKPVIWITFMFTQPDKHDGEEAADTAEPPKKITRSGTNVRLTAAKNVLERICVICEKKDLYYSQKSKTRKATMYTAKTKTAGKYVCLWAHNMSILWLIMYL